MLHTLYKVSAVILEQICTKPDIPVLTLNRYTGKQVELELMKDSQKCAKKLVCKNLSRTHNFCIQILYAITKFHENMKIRKFNLEFYKIFEQGW